MEVWRSDGGLIGLDALSILWMCGGLEVCWRSGGIEVWKSCGGLEVKKKARICGLFEERARRIELPTPAWEAGVMPFYDARLIATETNVAGPR